MSQSSHFAERAYGTLTAAKMIIWKIAWTSSSMKFCQPAAWRFAKPNTFTQALVSYIFSRRRGGEQDIVCNINCKAKKAFDFLTMRIEREKTAAPSIALRKRILIGVPGSAESRDESRDSRILGYSRSTRSFSHVRGTRSLSFNVTFFSAYTLPSMYVS